MKCFYHPTESAVGVCKACSKGLCLDCAADLGHGIACKNKHEQTVEDIGFLISKNTNAIKAAKNTSLTGVFFLGFMGFIFAGFGLFGRAEIIWFSTLIGAGFLISAALAFIQNRTVWSEK